jgi:hypothetical protein
MIDAPAPVLSVLCRSSGFHLIPIAKGRVDEDSLNQYPEIQKYCASSMTFEVKRSSYNDDSFTRSRRIKSSEVFFAKGYSR